LDARKEVRRRIREKSTLKRVAQCGRLRGAALHRHLEQRRLHGLRPGRRQRQRQRPGDAAHRRRPRALDLRAGPGRRRPFRARPRSRRRR
jgi:hypothetical protein